MAPTSGGVVMVGAVALQVVAALQPALVPVVVLAPDILISVIIFKIVINDNISTNNDNVVSSLYQDLGYQGVIEGVIRG